MVVVELLQHHREVEVVVLEVLRVLRAITLVLQMVAYMVAVLVVEDILLVLLGLVVAVQSELFGLEIHVHSHQLVRVTYEPLY
jgi:hypothetical protein